MSARFDFRYDVDYLMTAFDRHRAQHWSRYLSMLLISLALVFAAIYAYREFSRGSFDGVALGALHRVGDCYQARDIEVAVVDGHRVARTL